MSQFSQEMTMESTRVRNFLKRRHQNSDYKPIETLNMTEPNAPSRAFTIQIRELDRFPYRYETVIRNLPQNNNNTIEQASNNQAANSPFPPQNQSSKQSINQNIFETQSCTFQNQKPVEVKLQISIHIIQNKESEKQVTVFGNTYTSVGIPLKELQSKYTYQFAEKNPLCVFFHTNSNPSDQVFAIFNFFIHEMGENDISIRKKEIGLAEIKLSNEGQSTLNIRQAIFNQYLSAPKSLTQNPDLNARFVIEIQTSREFEKAKHLIPMMYLVDSQHSIVGLEVDPVKKIPHLPTTNNQPIKLLARNQITIENVDIQIPEAFETEILKVAQQQLLQIQSSAARAVDHRDVNISQVTLVCCYHNTRTAVNTGGVTNKIVLKDHGRVERQEDDDKQYFFRVFKSSGSIEIDNVFASDQAMVVFQLEYQVILSGPTSKMSNDYVVGYLPVYVSDKFGVTDQISDTFMIGGSKSITNKLMMKFQEKLPVYLTADINLQNANGGLSPHISTVYDTNQAQPNSQSAVPADASAQGGANKIGANLAVSEVGELDSRSSANIGSAQNNELLKQMAQLDAARREVEEKQREFDKQVQLQEMNQNQRAVVQEQKVQQLPLANAREMQEIIKNYEVRVQELSKTINQLKEENDQAKTQTQKEFSEIKELLGEMKRPRTTYNNFQDPFATGRVQNEIVITNDDDKKRWEILETLTTVPKMRSNFKSTQAFTQKPSSGAEQISNAEKVFLVNKGVNGLLDDTRQLNEETLLDDGDFITEYNDRYQASMFSIKVVAFRAQISDFSENDQIRKDSIFSENYYVPERMFFSYNFFQFEEERTEPVSYEEAGQVAAMKRILTDNKPIVLQSVQYLQTNSGPQQKAYNFKIDPSLFYSNVHSHFVEYLFRKSLHIDIWDADNLMIYGSVKISLRALLRQGRQQVEKQLSVPIIDSDFTRERGKLYVIISNRGYEPQSQESTLHRTLNDRSMLGNTGSNFRTGGMSQLGNTQLASNVNGFSSTGFKKKVRSDQPLTVEEASAVALATQNKKSAAYFSNDPEQRQKERIRRFKIKNLSKEKGEDFEGTKMLNLQEQHLKKISDIQSLKDERKGEYIKGILSNLLTSEVQYDALFGKTEFIQQDVYNSGPSNDFYVIRVDDPDADKLGFSELYPITLPEELRFFVEKHGIQGPEDVNFFDKDEKGRVSFTLPPGGRISIVFKFLTFRSLDPHVTSETNMEDLYRQQPIEYFHKYINTRTIDVHITSKNSRNENQGFKFHVKPHRQVVDHVFRYYERENKQVQLILPALYSYGQPPTERPTLYATNPNIQYEWLGDTEVSLQLRVPQVGRITRFNVLAYRDTFYHDLLANWEIEVHSLEGLDLKIDMGQSKQANLAMNSDSTRLVRFYSSHPLSAWFNEPFDRPYPISQGKVNQIGLTVRSFSLMKQRIQINCVDQNTKELLYSWIIRLETEKPVVTKMYDLKIPLNKESHIQKFSYQNRTPNESSYTFESSQIDLLQIVDSKTFLGPGEKTQVKIRIPRREQPGIGEVFVFITDDNERVECILFKLHFIINK